MCDLNVMGAPSKLNVIRKAAALARFRDNPSFELESEICLLLVVELEHLKIKTRLTTEKFASVKGECTAARHTCKRVFFFLTKNGGSQGGSMQRA